MYSPYVSLIKKMFPNAQIIIDTFHLVQLISRALNKTRIKTMKSNKTIYNKVKRYWKLILKDRPNPQTIWVFSLNNKIHSNFKNVFYY